MLVDNPSHTLSSSPKPERSPLKPSQKLRLQPSRFPVITDFFNHRLPRERKRGHENEKSWDMRKRADPCIPQEGFGLTTHSPGTGGTSRLTAGGNARGQNAPRTFLSLQQVAGGFCLDGKGETQSPLTRKMLPFKERLNPWQAAHVRVPPPIRPLSGLRNARRRQPQELQFPIAQDVEPSSTPKGVADPAPDEERRHRVVVDFDIPFLSSGKVFAATSYLGRGWLYELLSVVSGTSLSHPPPSLEVDGHMLSSTSTALDYTVFLPYACDSFAKVLNEPLTVSHEAFVNWNTNMHAVCSLVSWISAPAVGNDVHLIRTATLEYTGSLIARIDTVLGDPRERAKSLSSSMLSLYWFAVELLVRACWSSTGGDEDLATAINARLVGLTTRLLQIGVQAAISPVVTANDELLDDFPLYPCVAELWICLVHLGATHGDKTGHYNFPPMSDILQQSLQATESSAQGGLHASEEIWCTLFGLCALSQFSVHGVSMSTPRMSTSWDLVLLALERIRLVADPQIDDRLSTRNLRRRDAYIVSSSPDASSYTNVGIGG
ncbi:hypothetical protein B0F90DRAFT_441743 [Multifurca ochricompacta]|uniref:Uncharacterized protein n=1 Tax=Multifurca ochricompacta TaxID=376703 RepID=A0AAD4QHG0_9AGAM|nr:hypothetical protein B0F90DRAFT_441743 [Multifurca ochricompacta]